MKKLNIPALRQLANDNKHPFPPVLLTAIIQTYLGGLERVLQFLMLNIGLVFIVGTYIIITAAPTFAAGLLVWWMFSVLCVAGFSAMYLEYLYCSKGESFLTTVTGLSRLFCPDKNPDHRRAELLKTVTEIKETQS